MEAVGSIPYCLGYDAAELKDIANKQGGLKAKSGISQKVSSFRQDEPDNSKFSKKDYWIGC
jgi:hypothetical protein